MLSRMNWHYRELVWSCG